MRSFHQERYNFFQSLFLSYLQSNVERVHEKKWREVLMHAHRFYRQIRWMKQLLINRRKRWNEEARQINDRRTVNWCDRVSLNQKLSPVRYAYISDIDLPLFTRPTGSCQRNSFQDTGVLITFRMSPAVLSLQDAFTPAVHAYMRVAIYWPEEEASGYINQKDNASAY